MKINVAELLKDCPSGMELDCALYENLEFDKIDEDNDRFPIVCKVKTLRLDGYNIHTFTEDGCCSTLDYAKCVIFPKGKTTWEGFQRPFKDGDVIYNKGINALAIFYKQTDDCTVSHCFLNTLGELKICHFHSKYLYDWKFATEEEKEKLFQAIKDNGYKWNTETKTLEKLVELKFKVGDKVRVKNDKTVITITGIKGDYYLIQYYNTSKCNYQNEKVSFKDQDKYELVSSKFDIGMLKPFESRVLVRNADGDLWKPAIFGCYIKNKTAPYYALGGTCWHYCIPFEGNEHLLGKTYDCDEHFKTWK